MDETYEIDSSLKASLMERDRTELGVRVLGSTETELFPLPYNQAFWVGSSPEADLPLDDRTVSRAHLSFVAERGRVRAIDNHSTNGSTYEGSRFREIVLYPGSVVQVGQTELQILPLQEATPLAPSQHGEFGALRGRSLKMRLVFAVLERAARTEATVLLNGETGTGKEVAARALHDRSARRTGPYVVVDCASIPRSLIESELFGHEKGAFTHALETRKGAFEEADGGTIFLDEVGELPVDMQPRLLRVLETRTTKRVGGNEYRRVNVRVISATNRDLEEEVRQRRFRPDLFFRLAVIPVQLPPLRDRREDIPMLTRHFVEELAPERAGGEISPALLAGLMSADWPGNVRELRNVVQKAMATSTTELSLALDVRRATEPSPSAVKDVAALGLEVFFDLPYKDAKQRVIETFERAYVRHAVARAGGNISKAAQAIGLHRNMVSRLLHREGLDPKNLGDREE